MDMVRTQRFKRFEMKLFPQDEKLFNRVIRKQGIDFRSQAETVRMALKKMDRGK